MGSIALLLSLAAPHVLVVLRRVVVVPVHQTFKMLPYEFDALLNHFMIGHYLAQ